MKKDKRTPAQKKSSLKRATKRSKRLKNTQAEKPERKASLLAIKKHEEQKFQNVMDKLMQSRGLK